MPRFHYFAYGSNLLAERLVARCPSARPLGVVSVSGWRLAFQSKAFDGSGKATLIAGEASDVVHGRLFEIAVAERDALDKAEGADRDPPVYRRHDDFTVIAAEGNAIEGVSVYLAREETPALAPWDWYRALIVAGGMQAGLPADEVARIAVTPALPDVLPARKTRLAALAILEASGFPELAKACAVQVTAATEPAPRPAKRAAAEAASVDEVAERAVASAVAGL